MLSTSIKIPQEVPEKVKLNKEDLSVPLLKVITHVDTNPTWRC